MRHSIDIEMGIRAIEFYSMEFLSLPHLKAANEPSLDKTCVQPLGEGREMLWNYKCLCRGLG